MKLHPVQWDREQCEVCGKPGTDWDHCIFTRNKRFKKFVDSPFNMLRACWKCNRYTKETDRWPAKKWLIDFLMDSYYSFDFLAWIYSKPPKLQPLDWKRIKNYIEKKLEDERKMK